MTNGMVQNKQFSPVSSSFDKLRTNGLARNEGSKYFLPFVLSVRNEQSKYKRISPFTLSVSVHPEREAVEGSKYFLPFVLSVRNEQSKYRLPSTGSGQTECCKTNE